jgi:hypothetical protein
MKNVPGRPNISVKTDITSKSQYIMAMTIFINPLSDPFKDGCKQD